jgi:hypothetical protein
LKIIKIRRESTKTNGEVKFWNCTSTTEIVDKMVEGQ